MRVTKIANQNIKMALGQEVKADKIIDEVWNNFGRYIGELVFIDKLPPTVIAKRLEIVGLENITQFKQNNQPYLLCLSHMANWDFLISNIKQLYPRFSIVYRKANNPYVDRAILNLRQKAGVRMIAKGPSGARDLIRAIKNGDAIAMLVDQKMNDGIEVPFFGRPAMTANAIAKLSLQYDYPIIPCQIIRTSGSCFKAIIHPPIQYDQTGDSHQDQYNIMVKVNQIIEGWVRAAPGQWFWFHNRWRK